MRAQRVQLALGTVQFGAAYGVAGRGGPVPAEEVRSILSCAWDGGIRVLDTAPVYGDIEERLADLTGDPFEIVSKIPPLGGAGGTAQAVDLLRRSMRQSLQRLGPRLRTMLFHRGDDLLEDHAPAVWQAATNEAQASGLRIGGSFYSPEAAAEARRRHPIAAAQLPGNVLDQRIATPASERALAGMEVHLRSAFLQGLLLLPLQQAAVRVPSAARALTAWTTWCRERSLEPLAAALGVVKGMRAVDYCVVGVDSLSHLEQILAAWRGVTPLDASPLASVDQDVIDPRRWNRA